MAVGFAGSGGGINALRSPCCLKEVTDLWYRAFPMDVSLFVNRSCNLRCRHCYVAYKESENALTLPEWFALLEEFLRLGARRYGIVGMEPTLVWEKTLGILAFLANKRGHGYPIVSGMVTNAIRLDEKKCRDLLDVGIGYLDISLDGTKEIHDGIRGEGTYRETVGKITKMPDVLRKKLFISFTCNTENRTNFPALVEALYREGVTQFVFSPYATVGDTAKDPLYLAEKALANAVEALIPGEIFREKENVLVYIKGDKIVSGGFFNELVARNIIRSDKLFVDEHGMIFDERVYADGNRIVINYYPAVPPLSHSVRIFDDGRAGRCADMFYEQEGPGIVGNVRERPLAELLGLG